MTRRSISARVAAQGLRIGGTGQVVMPEPRHAGASERPGKARSGTGSRETILAALSEREFQNTVVEGLKQRGYYVFSFPEMRLTRAGWPDLTFFHPGWPGRIWFWELKRQVDARVSSNQLDVLEALSTIPGADVQIVRPLDWDVLKERLPEPLDAPEHDGREAGGQ